MDVSFRESVPFYGEKIDLTSLFSDLDSPNIHEDGVAEENETSRNEDNEQSKRMGVIIGSIPCPVPVRETIHEDRERRSHAEENLRVYTRRRRGPVVEFLNGGDTVANDEEQQPMVDQEQPPMVDQEQPLATSDEIDPFPQIGGEEADPSIDLPIAVRKGTRVTAGKPPSRYGFEDVSNDGSRNDIANYVSYESVSPSYKAFLASLQSVQIPRDWREAKQNPKWKEAMLEELAALEKNKT